MLSRLCRLALVSSLAIAAAAVLAAPARAADGCSSVSGVLTASLMVGDEGPGWYGVAYLSFGGAPHLLARTVDLNDGVKHTNIKDDWSGHAAGWETATFTVDGVGTFQLAAQFMVTCGPGGYSCYLHEQGNVVPTTGTGLFAGMTGNFSLQGPYAGGDCGPAQPCICIAEIRGVACTK